MAIESNSKGLFDSSDEEDDDMEMMLNKKKECAIQEKKQLELKKAQSRQEEAEGPELKFGVQDFVGESKDRVENKYYFMKPPLGAGLFGTVFKARHKQTGHIRAIKKIRKDHSKAKTLETLLKDVEVLKKLDHPNIIKVYEYFQDAGNIYIVTDYCGGGELFDRILQEKNFSENRAAEMMKNILSAIAYCHKNSLVHCDLKPENILLASTKYDETEMKIIDFGNSCFRKPEEMLKSKFGSVYYVAPEVLKASYNEKCDVWSLGVITFLLLSGKPPFNGPSDQHILKKVYSGKFSMDGPEWESISDEAKDLIRKMLIYNPDERISAKKCLEHPWFTNNAKEKVLRLDLPIGRRSLRNLKDFRAKSKLQESILYFLVSQLTTKEEEDELKEQFMAIDTDEDGLLTKEDLMTAFAKTGRNPEEAEQIVEQIMKNADKTGSGEIDYSEFLTASISKRKFFTEERLTMAFKLFDHDEKGYISTQDLNEIFNNGVFKGIDEGIWSAMIKEAAQHADTDESEASEGRITFDNFKTMMKKFTENETITQSIKTE